MRGTIAHRHPVAGGVLVEIVGCVGFGHAGIHYLRPVAAVVQGVIDRGGPNSSGPSASRASRGRSPCRHHAPASAAPAPVGVVVGAARDATT